MIHPFLIGEDLQEPLHGRRGSRRFSHGLVDEDANRTASGGLNSPRNSAGISTEQLGQRSMDGTRICAALRLLVLEAVELGKNFDGNKNMVVFESIETVWVVKENVGIENKIFRDTPFEDLTGLGRVRL